MSKLDFNILSHKDIHEIARLGSQLNPNVELKKLASYLEEMFTFPNYHCFGLKENNKLVAISSGWVTVRFYSGKQLEVDNVVVDADHRSAGLGKILFENIEEWAKTNSCQTIELNTYVQNAASHKFYFNLGYKILGFHFQKKLSFGNFE